MFSLLLWYFSETFAKGLKILEDLRYHHETSYISCLFRAYAIIWDIFAQKQGTPPKSKVHLPLHSPQVSILPPPGPLRLLTPLMVTWYVRSDSEGKNQWSLYVPTLSVWDIPILTKPAWGFPRKKLWPGKCKSCPGYFGFQEPRVLPS